MKSPHFIPALATPLNEDETLNGTAFEQEISTCLDAGLNGLFVGGSMGSMQLLSEETYRQLARHSVEIARGSAELLVGAGDTGFTRTRERILFLNTLPVDGVVVLAPYFFPYDQEELADYYSALADVSRAPLYLYDLPQVTRLKTEIDTAVRLSRHPNIRGIKCSDEPSYARQLRDMIAEPFRIIMAAPLMLDVFLRQGLTEHLDGIFCLCPHLIAAIGKAAVRGDWEYATSLQTSLNEFMRFIRPQGVWNPFTAMMHAQGVPGRFKPLPHRSWNEEQTAQFLAAPETRAFLKVIDETKNPLIHSVVREQAEREAVA